MSFEIGPRSLTLISNNEENEQQLETEHSLTENQGEAEATAQVPLILVASRQLKDAHVGTDQRSKPTTSTGSGTSLPNVPRVVIPKGQMEKSTSPSDEYDNDEPLTKKVTKIFKKRHRINPPAPMDSEESILGDSPYPNGMNDSFTGISQDSYIPQTDDTDQIYDTESSSNKYSSSGTFIVDDSELLDNKNDFPMGNLPPGFKLVSGMGFIYMAIPPDGGYGWLVLFLSFLAQLIVDGIVFSIGTLLPFMSADFNVSSAMVVFVASIQMGCYFLGGAFSSALINSYGFRPVALLGVVISALAILAASFSPNLATMILFYSIIGGPGLSMIWVSSQLIIGYYFERYRPIANGFSCSGAGAGVIIFCLSNSQLVQNIGWRNTIRVQVVLILLLFFVALAYLEVAPTPVGVLHHTDQFSSSSSNEYYGNFYVHNFLEEASSRRSHNVLESYAPPKRQGRLRRWASRCSPCFAKRPQKTDRLYTSPNDEDQERNYVVRADPMQREDLFYTGPADYDEPHSKEHFEGKQLELVGSQAHIQRAAYALHNIHDYDSTDDVEDTIPGSPATLKSASFPPAQNVYRVKKKRKPKKRSWLQTKIMRAIHRLFDIHLLKSFEFRVLLTSAFLYPMGFNIPFVYSTSRTTIPQEYARWITPAIGTSNFIVRILCGFVAYKLRSWTNYICGGGMVLGGAIVFISAFYGRDVIWFQFFYGLCYGIAPAVFSTLRAIIYVRYLGLSKLTNAFGITALAMGLGVFIGTSLGGFLAYQTGGYTAPFAFAGVCIIISGILKLILPIWKDCRRNSKQNS